MLAPVHDRSGREARVPLAVAATVDGGATGEGVGRPSIIFVLFTITADKASRESLAVKVGNAGFVVRKVLLKVWQILIGTRRLPLRSGIGDAPHSYNATSF